MTPEKFDEFIAQHIEWMRTASSDNSRVVAKRVQNSLGKSFWESVSAFANTSGGLFILGLSEPDGFTADLEFNAEQIKKELVAGFNTAPGNRPKVTPVPRHRMHEVRFEGQELIAVEIDAMRDDPQLVSQMPCFVTDQHLSKGSYRREFDGDRRLNAYEIHELQTWMQPDSSDREIIADALPDDIDEIAVQTVIAAYRAEGSRVISTARNSDDLLRLIKVLDYDEQHHLKPTLAGVLAVGRYPQQFFPQLFIDVTVHPTTEKSTSTAGIRFLSRKRCDGPLTEAVESAVAEVLGNLKTRYSETAGTVVNEKEIPELAIREAIANAVMHRDYGQLARGEQVAVDIYPDRVEITNPGGLWGGRTEENLVDGRSVTRNEALASILSHLHNARNERIAENQGSGIPAMIRAMTQHGLSAPRFKNNISSFQVTLRRFGLLDTEAQEWLESRGHQRSPIADVALILARNEGEVSTQSLRDRLGIDSDEAREFLAQLLVDGQLTAIDSEHYALAAQSMPQVSAPARELYEHISATTPRKTAELAELWGRSEGTVRLRVKKLIDADMVIPTAASTSKLRAYLRTKR
ncbi:ATP-binding protein [Corynebacterium epidermidicanis]|uniref:Putative transcriptional regulator with HTH domain n=1 Tax=Corynebacterium epidermidicanis TaxID=1050174 RepID=A0A0G3GT28_9CORY|nr:ATP-binding protein [Corynebacterium epidermidicanis]AKK04279.1 putative transcriptional regulator with HTH domain [Corynebacterium epidermidicanis]